MIDRDRRHLSRRSLLWSTLTAALTGAATSRAAPYTLPVTRPADLIDDRAAQEKTIPASGNGVANGIDDLARVLREALASQTERKDDIGRTLVGEIRLPPGRYRLNGPLELAPAQGLVGLTISGTGAGTEILFEGSNATIQCSSSRAVTFRDLTFRSTTGIDADQAAFTIDQHGNPLRSWKFERCEFIAFHRCFAVTGSSMSSEFYFDKCQFLQCYHLMYNNNEQAVNWNFVNCNWENTELATIKPQDLSAAFLLKKGTFVKWMGGSMVFLGRLILYDLKVSGSVQRPSHLVAFDAVRIELEGDDNQYVPFVDRIDAGYVSGTNQPTTIFNNCTILQRGTTSSLIYARAWANCSLSFVDCKAKGGRVVGILDHLSPRQTASIRLENTQSIYYEEDARLRLNSHDQHRVRIVPDNSAAGLEPIIDQQLCGLATPVTMHPKYMYVRSSTGSLPMGGTMVDLIPMPDHTVILRLFVQRFQSAGQRLSVELSDRTGGTTYATVTFESGNHRFAEANVGAEIGFQIPSGTRLALKFTGPQEIVKGIVGIEYL